MHLNSKISFKNIHLCLTTLFFTETLVRHNLKQNEALSTCTESVYLSHCLSPSLCHCLSPSLSLSLSHTHIEEKKVSHLEVSKRQLIGINMPVSGLPVAVKGV